MYRKLLQLFKFVLVAAIASMFFSGCIRIPANEHVGKPAPHSYKDGYYDGYYGGGYYRRSYYGY